MENSVEKFIQHFDEFADNTEGSRDRSARDRDYFDHKQLTDKELKVLKGRKQPPTVYNHIQPKINYLLGVERQTRTDPKGYPRNPNDENAAEAVTDALRYVGDKCDLDVVLSNCFESQLVEGTGAAITEYDPNKKSIAVNFIDWDRLYWDVHSRRADFSDSKRFGIVAWMDIEDVKDRWEDKAADISATVEKFSRYSTYDDKPGEQRWVDRNRNRIMVMQEYYLEKGRWYEVWFCYGAILEHGESPYLDEDGLPSNPIEMQSSFVDREGMRYGLVRAYIDAQDEINKRRSKALHILNTNQTIAEDGAVKDVNKFKAEKNKPDGHMTVNNGMMDKVQFVNQQAELMAHFNFMQDAQSMIDAVGANATVGSSASGRSQQVKRRDEFVEVAPLFDRHSMFKRRIYRQIWSRIKQFWDEEKWVRVTDNEDALKFIGLNVPVTLAEKVQEHAKETGEEIPQELMNDPRLNQVVEIRNNVKELDLDIILSEQPDYVSLQHETFENVMSAIQATGTQIPLELMLDLMPSVPNKRELLDKLKGDEQQQAMQQQLAEQQKQIQDLMVQLGIQKEAAEIEKTQSETAENMADAQLKQIEAMKKMVEPIG